MVGVLAVTSLLNERSIMTNYEVRTRYETAIRSIRDQRNRAHVRSNAAGASI